MIGRDRLGPGAVRLLALADVGGVGLHEVMALLGQAAGPASGRLCSLVGGGHLVKARVPGEPARWFTSAEAARAHEAVRRPVAAAASLARKRARQERHRPKSIQAKRDHRAQRAAARALREQREHQRRQAGAPVDAARACVPGGFAAAGIGRYLDT